MTSVEVTVVSTLRNYECRTTISTHTNQTIESVIKECCLQNGWTRRSDFALCNQNQELMYKSDRLCDYYVQSGDELYLIIHDLEEWACGCSQWWLLSAICLLIAVCGITAVSILQTRKGAFTPEYRYEVGLDAGSSHTQLYVYRWLSSKYNGTGIIVEQFSCPYGVNESSEAINSFADNPSAAGASLEPCLNKTLQHLNSTSGVSLAQSRILLGATAGMRLLSERNSTVADEIMTSVRDTIKSYPFNVSQLDYQVRVIDGTEEGAYAWISTNFLNGSFGFRVMSEIEPIDSRGLYTRDPLLKAATIGALDLGGASTQIAFETFPNVQPTSDYISMHQYGYNYTVYTHSYLCYGSNEALRQYRALLVMEQDYNETIDDPCAPLHSVYNMTESDVFFYPCTSKNKSYSADSEVQGKVYTFHGQSDASKCHNLTHQLFDFGANCTIPPCSFNGTHQPNVSGPFVAFSGFYYTMRFLNLTSSNETASLEKFEMAKDSYCNKTWEEVEKIPLHPGEDASYRLSACFKANYMRTLLIDAYHFDDNTWTNIEFRNKLNGADLGWIVGMMVNSTNLSPAYTPPPAESISVVMFTVLLSFFVLFLLLSIAFAGYARTVRHRQRVAANYREVPSNPPSSTYGSMEDRQPLPI